MQFGTPWKTDKTCNFNLQKCVSPFKWENDNGFCIRDRISSSAETLKLMSYTGGHATSFQYTVSLVQWVNCLPPAEGDSGSRPGDAHLYLQWNRVLLPMSCYTIVLKPYWEKCRVVVSSLLFGILWCHLPMLDLFPFLWEPCEGDKKNCQNDKF